MDYRSKNGSREISSKAIEIIWTGGDDGLD